MFSEKIETKKYDVKLKLKVEDNDGNKEYFSKQITLSFPPYIGLQVLLAEGGSGNPTDPIKTVIWNQFSNVFVCNVDWRFPPHQYSDGEFWSIHSHIACAESDGWELE